MRLSRGVGCARHLCSGAPVRPGASTWRSPITKTLWETRERLANDGKGATEQQVVLLTKTPSASTTRVLYDFDTNAHMRERYLNPFGTVRIGTIFEDMDALAGNCAFMHADDDNPATLAPILVTASVDRISLDRPIKLDAPLELVGKAVWAGRSSMRIRMEAQQGGEPAMSAFFTFVARDASTGKATPVNKLRPETAEEVVYFEEGEALTLRRKQQRSQSAEQALEASQARASREAKLLRNSAAHLQLPCLAGSDSILMAQTAISNAFLCQPQQRNTAGRIFGGFLMRRAFELAISNCYLFAGSVPAFEAIEHVSFRAPVEVGALLRLHSSVVLTQPHLPCPLVTIDVIADVAHPEKRSSVNSNTFTFTFRLSRAEMERTGNVLVKKVLPSNGEEAKRQLEVIELLGCNDEA